MKIITINLPMKYIDAIQILQDLGRYSSRSEAVRKAIKELLIKDLRFDSKLQKDNFKMGIISNIINKRGGVKN